MISVWPFIPVGDTVETLSWLTEVIQTKASEQRIQLRQVPRRQFDFSHALLNKDVVAAASLVSASDEFYIPDWTTGQIGSVLLIAGTNLTVAMDTTDLWIGLGSHVGWLKPNGLWEVTMVTDHTPSSITLANVSESVSSASLWIFDRAVSREGVSFDTRPGGLTRATVSFETALTLDGGHSEYPQYRGHDVLTDTPVVGSGSLKSSGAWDYDDIDNSLGAPTLLRNRKTHDRVFSMRWHYFSKGDIKRNRKWIFSRIGKLKAFWLPSFQNDMKASVGITDSGTTLSVFAPEKSIDFGRQTFDIEIYGLSLYRRRVLAVAHGSLVGGMRTLNLLLDSSLGTTHSTSQIGRISFLRCVRFNADRIEFSHNISAGVSVAVPCIEVPVP